MFAHICSMWSKLLSMLFYISSKSIYPFSVRTECNNSLLLSYVCNSYVCSSVYLQFLISDINTARPLMPSPLTGAIVVSLLIFAGFMQTRGEERSVLERSSRCGALIAQAPTTTTTTTTTTTAAKWQQQQPQEQQQLTGSSRTVRRCHLLQSVAETDEWQILIC